MSFHILPYAFTRIFYGHLQLIFAIGDHGCLLQLYQHKNLSIRIWVLNSICQEIKEHLLYAEYGL